jgi:pullulanase
MDSHADGGIHLRWAAWTSLTAGMASFSSDWKERGRPELWLGEDRLPIVSVKRAKAEEFGLHGGYFSQRGRIIFVCPASRTQAFDLDEGLFVAGSFNGWGEAVGRSEWRMEMAEIKGELCHTLAVSQRRLGGEGMHHFKFVTGSGHWIEVGEDVPNAHVDPYGIKNYIFDPKRTGKHRFHIELPTPLNQSEGRRLYFNNGEHVDSVRLSPGVFLKSLKTDVRLGSFVADGLTFFRLFAPRASKVELFVFNELGAKEPKAIELGFTDDLVWEVALEGNYHGWYYYYKVAGEESNETGYFNADFKVPDPYARAVVGPMGPGIVTEDAVFERTDDGFEAPSWHDLVITEAHLRDLTANAPVPMSGHERDGFTGLRKWVESDDFYISQMGVNAIELQPIQEFDTKIRTDYGWGYMPVNYFSPASQYSLDPLHLSQIGEFRDLVTALHGKGLAVILDVVYNHVGEPNFLQYLDREYYFLLTAEGYFENHSGCGNTLDCNTPMVRRLIRDSLVHLIEAYGVDGFRFDLGELIGKETLAWLEAELKLVKPGILLVAEPWSFRGHIARDLKETGVASWNDGYREKIREYLTGDSDAHGIRYFVQGSPGDWSRFPAQTVNYVDSHDDRCWIDKITENPENNGHRPTGVDRRRTHLMISLQMMSLGIPMLSSGVDFMKSKGGVNNTYLNGDLNAIPYVRGSEYSGTVAYFRNWIRFRLGPLGRLLRLDGFPLEGYFEDVQQGHLFGMLYNADSSAGTDQLFYAVNPTFDYASLRMKGMDFATFTQLADTECWGSPGLNGHRFPVAGDSLVLPALSCGLFWRQVH